MCRVKSALRIFETLEKIQHFLPVFMCSIEKLKKHLVKETSFFWFFFWRSKKMNNKFMHYY